MLFAQWLRERRLEHRLTQIELGRRVNIGPGAVSAWERGEFLPNLETFRALCVVLSCSADEPLGLPDDAPRQLKAEPLEADDQPQEGVA
jgi:transcriptional regulator with XRE-family HTH domain